MLPLLFLLLASYGFMQGNTMAGALNVDLAAPGSISALMGAASFGAGALAASLAGAVPRRHAAADGRVVMLAADRLLARAPCGTAGASPQT